MLDVDVKLKRGPMQLNATLRDEGSICLCGQNGAGKTTLFRIIAGSIRPDSGHVKINSVDVTAFPPEKRGVVLVNPDSLIPHLDVERHLRWGAQIRKVPLDESFVARVKESLGVGYSGRVDELSLGMRERVSLSTALLSKPKVILVDEAFSNIDHKIEFMSSYRDLCSDSRVDLVFTTQHKSDEPIAEHVYEISDGNCTRLN